MFTSFYKENGQGFLGMQRYLYGTVQFKDILVNFLEYRKQLTLEETINQKVIFWKNRFLIFLQWYGWKKQNRRKSANSFKVFRSHLRFLVNVNGTSKKMKRQFSQPTGSGSASPSDPRQLYG